MKLIKLLWGMGVLGAAVAVPCAAQTTFHEKVTQTITINAEPAKVWALVSDFEGAARWNTTVEKSTGIDEDKEQLTRLLVFKDSVGKEVDELDERSDADMTLRYHVRSSPWPTSRFNVVLRVSRGPTPGTSVVEWRGSFDTPGTNVDPDGAPPITGMPAQGPMIYGFDVETYDTTHAGGKDRAVQRDKRTVKIVSDLYRAGLDSLKWLMER